MAFFPGAEGRFHVWVDANADGLIDARVRNVPSGQLITIYVDDFATGEDEWLVLSLDKRVYPPTSEIFAQLTGHFTLPRDIYLELWHPSSREPLWISQTATASGELSLAWSFVTSPEWPLTGKENPDDYVLVPIADGVAWKGSRFSVRYPTVSNLIGEMSVSINSGALYTSSSAVLLNVSAQGASGVSFFESPDADFLAAASLPFATLFPYAFDSIPGTKQIWAWFFDENGDYAGPVNDSIILLPAPPTLNAAGLVVESHAPGTSDFLTGLYGTATPGYRIRVFRSPLLSPEAEIATTTANADGSFGPLDIGDNLVFRPADIVFVIQEDPLLSWSNPETAYNDATPPKLWPTDIMLYYAFNPMKRSVKGFDQIHADYQVPASEPTASDVVGGEVEFSQFGVPLTQPLNDQGEGLFRAAVSVSPSAADASEATVMVRVHDAAMNMSPWVKSAETLAIDNTPPIAPTITWSYGGDGLFHAVWDKFDSGAFTFSQEPLRSWVAVFTDLSDPANTVAFEFDALDGCISIMRLSATCYYYVMSMFKQWIVGTHPLEKFSKSNAYAFPLDNCRTWEMRLAVRDLAGNLSPFSHAVTQRLAPPPPLFTAWAGLDGNGDGSVVYSISPAPSPATGPVQVLNGNSLFLYFSAEEYNALSAKRCHDCMTSRDGETWYELLFDTDGIPPYAYSASNITSPALFKQLPRIPYIGRIRGLPVSSEFHLSARAIDPSASPACYSDFGDPAIAVTDLRILARADGAENTMLGGAVTKADDFDADGIDDYLIGASKGGYLAMVSGDTGRLIDSFGGFSWPANYGLAGDPLAAVQLDGDPQLELLVGMPLDSTGGLLAGSVYLYDDDLSLITKLNGTSQGMHLGFAVARLGDISVPPDGIDEFIVGAFNCTTRLCGVSEINDIAAPTEGPGRVTVFDGASRVPIYMHTGQAPGDYFGAAIASGADFDGDGVNDYAVGAPGLPAIGFPMYPVRVFSGRTGSQIFTAQPPNWLYHHRFGASVSFVPDVNGDGKADLAVGALSNFSTLAGAVLLYASTSAAPLWSNEGTLLGAGPNYGMRVAGGADVSGDGVPDIAIGAPGFVQDYFFGSGSVFLADGKTGRLLYEMQGASFDGGIGYSTLLPGNVYGDAPSEWVVASPSAAFNGFDAGRIYILTTSP